jgi:hypothetical protein
MRLWLRKFSQRSCKASAAGLLVILVPIGDLAAEELPGPGKVEAQT